MAKSSMVTYRLRIPVSTRRRKKGQRRNGHIKNIKGGFLPLLAPILAAAIGAIPGIASVALNASRN
ncbi:pX [Bat mastadenovirus WIV12]|uniref:PX n=1 Tax=Bat mastadenovirus WIV12 TaxID=1788434 RepID=A0A1B0UI15_9ADEN|nr:pX [Bat mastadenovirus WIV12]AMB43155.1 pX [Bat mastadenovirus WIV12]